MNEGNASRENKMVLVMAASAMAAKPFTIKLGGDQALAHLHGTGAGGDRRPGKSFVGDGGV
ncbi:MAG: hypothetical protein ABR534_10430 [Desulfotignum sp.]